MLHQENKSPEVPEDEIQTFFISSANLYGEEVNTPGKMGKGIVLNAVPEGPLHLYPLDKTCDLSQGTLLTHSLPTFTP